MNDENTAEVLEDEEAVDEIRVAFDDAVAGDELEDSIKMSMIGAGATFKNVTRLYNQYLIDAGMAISKEEKDEIVAQVLDVDDLDISTETGFESAVAEIVEGGTGITDKSAASLIRAWAKKNEVESWKKPKGEGAQRNSFVHKFYDALAANPSMTEDEAHNFIHGKEGNDETSQNVKNYEKMHQNVRNLCNNIAANYSAAEAA